MTTSVNTQTGAKTMKAFTSAHGRTLKSFTIQSVHTSLTTVRQYLRREDVGADLQAIPQIGPKTEDYLRQKGIDEPIQLYGHILFLHHPDITSIEYCNKIVEWFREEIGLRGPINGIIRWVLTKLNIFFPGLYDEDEIREYEKYLEEKEEEIKQTNNHNNNNNNTATEESGPTSEFCSTSSLSKGGHDNDKDNASGAYTVDASDDDISQKESTATTEIDVSSSYKDVRPYLVPRSDTVGKNKIFRFVTESDIGASLQFIPYIGPKTEENLKRNHGIVEPVQLYGEILIRFSSEIRPQLFCNAVREFLLISLKIPPSNVDRLLRWILTKLTSMFSGLYREEALSKREGSESDKLMEKLAETLHNDDNFAEETTRDMALSTRSSTKQEGQSSSSSLDDLENQFAYYTSLGYSPFSTAPNSVTTETKRSQRNDDEQEEEEEEEEEKGVQGEKQHSSVSSVHPSQIRKRKNGRKYTLRE